MSKEVKEERSENMGEGDNYEQNKLNSSSAKFENDYEERKAKNLKTRSSRERKEPIGGEIEERDRRNGSSGESEMYEGKNSQSKHRKHGDKSRKAHQRSRSNLDEPTRLGERGSRNSKEYSDDM